MKNWVEKTIAIVLLILFLLNFVPIIGNYQGTTRFSNKMLMNDSQNILLAEQSDYNYWYNYTLNKLNETGALTGNLSPLQKKILENVTQTYLLREINYFNTPKYNNFNYWELWLWDNLAPVFWGNITFDYFQTHTTSGEKRILQEVIQIYWALMINNLTIPEADALLSQLPMPDPDPVIINFNPITSKDSKVNGTFQVYAPNLLVWVYDLHWEIVYYRTYAEQLSNVRRLYDRADHFNWPGLTNDPLFSYSVDNPGYTGLYALTILYYRWWYFGEHSATSGLKSWCVDTINFTVADDDTSSPLIQNPRAPATSGDIPDAYAGDYRINISYWDYSGWEGYIRIQYDRTDMADSPVYEIDGGYISSTQKGGILTFKIPKNAGHAYDWGNWIDTTKTVIRYWSKAVDLDRDNAHITPSWDDPRGSDQSATPWFTIKEAGRIWSSPGASIIRIEQRNVLNLANQWIWELSDIKDDGIYTDQPFIVEFQVTNPTSEIMQVTSGIITMTWSGGSGGPLSPTFWSTPKDILAWNSWTEPLIMTLDYTTIATSLTTLTITIVFQYRIGASLYSSMTIIMSFTIKRPPEPTFQFKGYEGYTEGGHFVYKTKDGGLSRIWAVFQVNNMARIPIRVTQGLNFLSSEDLNLLQITNPLPQMNYPGVSEIRIPLDVKSAAFFVDVSNWASRLLNLGSTVLIAKHIIDAIDAYFAFIQIEGILDPFLRYAKPLRGTGASICTVISTIIAVTETILMTWHYALPKDESRSYQFTSTTSWEYQVAEGNNFKSNEDVGYTDSLNQPIPYILYLTPSSWQWDEYRTGEALHWTAIGLSWLSIGLTLAGITAWAGIAADVASLVTERLASSSWQSANDPPLPDSNYTEIYNPVYRDIPIGIPQNSLESSIKEMADSSRFLEGDLQALNVSLARKDGAIAARDNASAIKQWDAIYNYSIMVSQDYTKIGEDMVIFGSEFNKSMDESNITQIEEYINTTGISEEERGNLLQAGLNDTEISTLVNYSRQLAESHSASLLMRYFRNATQSILGNISKYFTYLLKQGEFYNNLTQEALNQSIILKTTTQNKPIKTADPAILDTLEILKIQANDKLNEQLWSAAKNLALELKNLALITIQETLNQTYFSYVEEADIIIENAEEKMKIDLIPSKEEIKTKAGVVNSLDLIAISTGAPSGIYTLISNNSWIQPAIQVVNVIEWKFTRVPITINIINSFSLETGRYPINLTIYLEGTDIRKSIIIIVIVTSTKVENNLNYIFYEIADLRKEVDDRVSFLFDWIIINQLDTVEVFLNEALEAYHADMTVTSLVLDKLAKANIELSNLITVILYWIGFVSEEDGDFISNYLHTIRDHITLTMGATIGTEAALKVAAVETQIERLADQIFNTFRLYPALSIDLKLWAASEHLDYALFFLALGDTEIAKTQIVQCETSLNSAKDRIIQFRDSGDIPTGEAQSLIAAINGFITELTGLHSHVLQEGPSGGSIPTHQPTGPSSITDSSDSTSSSNQDGEPNIVIPSH